MDIIFNSIAIGLSLIAIFIAVSVYSSTKRSTFFIYLAKEYRELTKDLYSRYSEIYNLIEQYERQLDTGGEIEIRIKRNESINNVVSFIEDKEFQYRRIISNLYIKHYDIPFIIPECFPITYEVLTKYIDSIYEIKSDLYKKAKTETHLYNISAAYRANALYKIHGNRNLHDKCVIIGNNISLNANIYYYLIDTFITIINNPLSTCYKEMKRNIVKERKQSKKTKNIDTNELLDLYCKLYDYDEENSKNLKSYFSVKEITDKYVPIKHLFIAPQKNTKS
ncbi:MAG TPA: hypothetical protein VM054_08280 [bacterium]|nr:hypothetical protein [bacterium]